MKTIGKILGLLVVTLFLLLAVLGLIITQLFDPNDYKEHIRTLARDKAHIELRLDGDIGWSLFPWLGLELRDTRIASLSAPQATIADVRQLGLSVKAWPLLRKEVQMSDIRVQGVTLNLKRDEQGRGNWQDLGQAPHSAQDAAAPAAPQAEGAPEAAARTEHVSVDIDSLRISDAKVIYQDAQSGKTFTAEGIEFSTGAIADGRAIPLKLEVFIGTNQPVLRTRNQLSATLHVDQAKGRYVLENLELTGVASGEPLAGKTLNYSAHAQLAFDQRAQTLDLTHAKLRANALEALGEVRLRELNDALKWNGALSIARFNAREFLDSIGYALPPTQDANTLQSLELNSLLEGSANSLLIKELSLNLDQSHLNGEIKVRDIAKQALGVTLNVDQLNLDRYLSPTEASSSLRQAEVKDALARAGSQGSTALPAAPTTSAWSNQALFDAKTLNGLNLQLALTAKEFTVKDWPLQNLSLKASARQGQTNLSELRAEVKGGQLSLTGDLDSRQSPWQWRLNPEVNNLPFSLLLKEQKPAPIKGLLQLNAALTSQGNSEQALIDALNGNGQFALLDGVLVDANLEQQLCRAIATVNRKALTDLPNSKDTPFNTLKGSLLIRNGIATNSDLITRIPGLTLTGNGDIDLRVLGLDYRVGLTIDGDQREMPDPACQVNKRYVGIAWPLHCRGPMELGAKACRMDSQGLPQIATKLATDKLGEKIEEKLGDKASPELKDALKKLLNR